MTSIFSLPTDIVILIVCHEPSSFALFGTCKYFADMKHNPRVAPLESAAMYWVDALNDSKSLLTFSRFSEGENFSSWIARDLEAYSETGESDTVAQCSYACLLHAMVRAQCDFHMIHGVLSRGPHMAYVRDSTGRLPVDIARATQPKNRVLQFLLEPRKTRQGGKFSELSFAVLEKLQLQLHDKIMNNDYVKVLFFSFLIRFGTQLLFLEKERTACPKGWAAASSARSAAGLA